MKIRHTWENIDQPQDEQIAGSPWFYVSTYREFHAGLVAALQELEKYSSLVAELELESSPYEKEIRRLKRMMEWGKERLEQKNEEPAFDEITISGVTWRSLRYLKAGILFRAQQLIEKRREALKQNRFIPRSIIQSFDERIEQLLNLGEQGMLNGLRPADIFFEVLVPLDEGKPEQPEPTLKSPVTGANYVSLEMPIIDPVLRERCLGLLRAVVEGGSENQLDSIVREMSVVLEDRVRQVSGYMGKLTGAELFSALMAKDPLHIKFSAHKDAQESAHLLFRGYSGFVRNEVMHKLVHTYTNERVLQLLGTVDYLLFLLSRAESTKIKEGDS
jgi:hypothetical protein